MASSIHPFLNITSTHILNLNPYTFLGHSKKYFEELPSERPANYKKILIPKDINKRSKFQRKGLIFVWPQKRSTFNSYNKELVWLAWIVAHGLYWFHAFDFLPTGRALPFKQPPWKYEPPLHRPKSRDFIIEPDWDSKY